MADRQVTRTGEDMTEMSSPYVAGGGAVSRQTRFGTIEYRWHTYYVSDSHGRRANVQVVNGRTGKYLRTDPNTTCSDNLPNC